MGIFGDVVDAVTGGGSDDGGSDNGGGGTDLGNAGSGGGDGSPSSSTGPGGGSTGGSSGSSSSSSDGSSSSDSVDSSADLQDRISGGGSSSEDDSSSSSGDSSNEQNGDFSDDGVRSIGGEGGGGSLDGGSSSGGSSSSDSVDSSADLQDRISSGDRSDSQATGSTGTPQENRTTSGGGEAAETIQDAVDTAGDAADEAVETAGEFKDDVTQSADEIANFVQSGEDEPSVGDDDFRDEMLADPEDTGPDPTGDQNNGDSFDETSEFGRTPVDEDDPRLQNGSEGNTESNDQNVTPNINVTDSLNTSEIDDETREDIISRAANNSDLNESDIRVDELLIGQQPETPEDVEEDLPQDVREDLRERAAEGTPFDADDLAVSDVEETQDGQEVSFETAETQTEIERTEEGLQSAVDDAINRLDQQVEGQDIDRTDVEVSRTESGGIEVELTPQAEARSEPPIADPSFQGTAVASSNQAGRFTSTDSSAADENILDIMQTEDEDDIDGGIEIGDTTIAARGEDFPDSVEEVPSSLSEDAQLIQTELPTTQSGRREAISSTLQDETGIEAEAPIRNTRREAINAAYSTFEDLRNGNVTDEAGGAAGAATLAIAAPEPVSSGTGVAVLGGLAIAGGVTAIANDQAEIDAPEDRSDLPGEGSGELESPEGGESVTTSVEIEAPEDRSGLLGEGGGEVGAPEDRSDLPGEGSGELEAPEDRGDLPGERAPSDGDLTIETTAAIGSDTGTGGITGPQEPSIDQTQEPSITEDGVENENERRVGTGESAFVNRDSESIEEPEVEEEAATTPEISEEEALQNALQRVDQSGPLSTSIGGSGSVAQSESTSQSVSLAEATGNSTSNAAAEAAVTAQNFQDPFENINVNETAESTTTLTETQAEANARVRRRLTRPRRFEFEEDADTGFDTESTGSTSTFGGGDESFAAGWFNEFTTAFAVGPGPREAPSDETLEDADAALLLTGQLPTEAQVLAEGDEAAAIDEAESTFFAGFGGGGGNGGGLL